MPPCYISSCQAWQDYQIVTVLLVFLCISGAGEVSIGERCAAGDGSLMRCHVRAPENEQIPRAGELEFIFSCQPAVMITILAELATSAITFSAPKRDQGTDPGPMAETGG
jgi:hypothetical protein